MLAAGNMTPGVTSARVVAQSAAVTLGAAAGPVGHGALSVTGMPAPGIGFYYGGPPMAVSSKAIFSDTERVFIYLGTNVTGTLLATSTSSSAGIAACAPWPCRRCRRCLHHHGRRRDEPDAAHRAGHHRAGAAAQRDAGAIGHGGLDVRRGLPAERADQPLHVVHQHAAAGHSGRQHAGG